MKKVPTFKWGNILSWKGWQPFNQWLSRQAISKKRHEVSVGGTLGEKVFLGKNTDTPFLSFPGEVNRTDGRYLGRKSGKNGQGECILRPRSKMRRD